MPVMVATADLGNMSPVVEKMFAEAGEVELLVNNAGVAHYGLVTDLTYADWRELMAVNLDGAFLCCRAAVPGMVRRKKGNIVIVSSMWGQVGASCEAAYSASKAGLCGLTKALAKELAPSFIRVNCVAPGVLHRFSIQRKRYHRLSF